MVALVEAVLVADHQHRAAGQLDDLVGDAAEQQPAEGSQAPGAEDDQGGVQVAGVLEELIA